MITTRSDKILDLIWSPNTENEFVAFGSDLHLLRVKDGKRSQGDNIIQISDEAHAELIANYADNTNPRIVAWCLDKSNPYTFAVYFNNQNIKLISLNPERLKNGKSFPFRGFDLHKEFAFKQLRLCNNLAWNHHQKTYIAAGFQPIRNEHSILVWDVHSTSHHSKVDAESVILTTTSPLPSLSNSSNLLSSLSAPPSSSSSEQKPVYETGNSDTCNSLAWNPYSPYGLLVGVNGKTLKVYDIRVSKASTIVNTKYVYNFSMDPSNSGGCEYQAASYYDKCVALWDLRRMEKPVHTITEPEPVIKIQWCPFPYRRNFDEPTAKTTASAAAAAVNKPPDRTRRNSLTGKLITLTKSSDQLNIYSIKSVNDSENESVAADENAPVQLTVDKKTRKCPVRKLMTREGSAGDLMTSSLAGALPEITSFCWNYFDANKLLVSMNATLSNLRTLCLSDAIAMAWSPNGEICWSSSVGRVNLIESLDKNEFDFQAQLKERTKNDYGLKYEIITISNGTATSVPSTSSSMNQQPGTPTSSPIMPLALSLNSSSGVGGLIRPEFSSFSKMYTSCDRVVTKNVKFLWHWFESVNLLFEKLIPVTPRGHHVEHITHSMRSNLIEYFPLRYSGLKALLDQLLERRINSPDSNHIYEDRFRLLAFNLCGWEMKDNNLTRQFFANLENTKQIERAACLAVLTHNFALAFDILDAANKTDDRYGCFWIALKCFYEEHQQQQQYLLKAVPPPQQQSSTFSSPGSKHQSSPTVPPQTSQLNSSSSFSKSPFFNSMSSQALNDSSSHHLLNNTIASEMMTMNGGKDKSKQQEQQQQQQQERSFNDPYLQAMFNYLTIKEEAIIKILHDEDILFQDRIALSVHFMFNPSKQIDLQHYFETVINKECILKADLHGVLLTGLSPACIDLFQNFIEQTNDIQTVSLAIIYTPFADVIQSKQVQYWIDSYRELLNSFKFWEKRAEFDVLKMKVCKIQQYVPPVVTTLSTAENSTGGNYDPHNISPTSSSSFSPNNTSSSKHSSLISLPPSGHHPGSRNHQGPSNQNAHSTLNPPLAFLPHGRLSLPANQIVSKHPQAAMLLGQQFHGHTYPNFIHSQQLFNATLAVHLNCNKCGKNLLDKSSSSHLEASQRASTLNFSHATGHMHQFFSSTSNPLSQQISISTKPSSHNVSMSGSNKHTNEHYIFGCQSCAHFLPQCTICLKVMRINLYPSPLVMVSSSNTNSSLMSMNRSQSFFMQSPQIMLPVSYASQSNIKNVGASTNKQQNGAANMIKSPLSSTNLAKMAASAHNPNNLMPQSKSSNEILASSNSNGCAVVPVKSTFGKPSGGVKPENYEFLSNCKLGKWFAWCQSCKHGGHIEHLIEWFSAHQTCPFMHCKCECLNIDSLN